MHSNTGSSKQVSKQLSNDAVIKVVTLHCNKCGHQWVPRKMDVRQCPACQTCYWNKSEYEITKLEGRD